MLINNKNKHTSCFHCLIILLIICLYWHTPNICETSATPHNNKLIRGKMNSYAGLREKNLSVIITTCWQLSKVHFSTPKMSEFLNSKLGRAAEYEPNN